MTQRLFLLATVVAAALYAEDFAGKVVGITDGDTIKVSHNRGGAYPPVGDRLPGGKAAVRNAGETVHRDRAFGNTVTVKVRDIDRYKCTVAEIILPDGRNLNQELVRAGLAWWYQQYARKEMVLRDLEQEARAAKRGLWTDPKPVSAGAFWVDTARQVIAHMANRGELPEFSTTIQ